MDHLKTKMSVDVLDNDNWGHWSQRLLFFLDSKGLGDAVREENYSEWTEGTGGLARDRQARAFIGLSVKDHHLATIAAHETAYAVWAALELQFKAKTTARKLQLRKELGELKMRDAEKLGEYVARTKMLYGDLTSAGHKLDETDVVLSLLAGLPPNYKTITDILVISLDESELTFSTVYNKLLTVEAEHERLHPSATAAAVAYMARSAGKHGGERECWHCGKKGHVKAKCYKWLAEQQAEQQHARGCALATVL